MHGPDSVDLNRVLAGRKDREAFHWFLDEIASVVVGDKVVKRVNCVRLPCDWLSPSLEAFSLLCFENYFDRIKSEVRKDGHRPNPKWTAEGRGSKKNQGWQQEGIKRYNELVEKVRIDRNSLRKEDEVYLRIKQEERMKYENEKMLRRKEALGDKEKGLLVAKDDFSSSSDSDSESG